MAIIEEIKDIEKNIIQIVPVAVDSVLSRDYWAGIKLNDIYNKFLQIGGIDSNDYHSLFGEELKKSIRENDYSELLLTMMGLNGGVRQYIDDHLPELNLENFQKTLQKQVKYQYQQRDYRKRLMDIVSNHFGNESFSFNDLCRALEDEGKPTKEGSCFVKDTLDLFVKQEAMKKSRVKRRIYYQCK